MYIGYLIRYAAATSIFVGSMAISQVTMAAEVTIRIGWPEPDDTPAGHSIMLFKQLVEERSTGEIEVQTFPSLQLGPIVEQIEGVRSGTQEMMLSTPAWFSRFYPGIDVLSMPYLVTSWEQAERMVNSEAFDALLEEAEMESGVKIIGALPLGFRDVMNTRGPIHRLEDFSGLKIRLQNSPAQLATFRQLGANPVTLPWDGLYQALQTGVVDGMESPMTTLYSHKFYEVAVYVSKTRHFYEPFLVYMNKYFFDNLSDEHRSIIEGAMAETEAKSFEHAQEAELEAEKRMVEAGAEINELTPESLVQLQKRVGPVYEQFSDEMEPHLSALRKAAIE